MAGSALVTKDIEFKAGETFAVEASYRGQYPWATTKTIDITEPVAEKPHKSKPSKAEIMSIKTRSRARY